MYIYIYILQTQICTERNWTYSNPAWRRTREKEFNAIGKQKAVVYLTLCLPCSLLSFVKSIFATPIRKRQRVINRDRGTSNIEDGKGRREEEKREEKGRGSRVWTMGFLCNGEVGGEGEKKEGEKEKNRDRQQFLSTIVARVIVAKGRVGARNPEKKSRGRDSDNLHRSTNGTKRVTGELIRNS